MNYRRIYSQFLADRRSKEGQLVRPYDRHHILPRALGGTNAVDNLISLSFADHFFAHLLLAQIYPGKMTYAAQMMRNRVCGTHGKIARRQYSWVRLQFAREKAINQALRMQNPELRRRTSEALKGKAKSPESIAKRTEARKGYKHAEETLEKMRASHRGKRASPATRAQRSAALKGRKKSKEHLRNIAAALKGVSHTEERKLNQSAAIARAWQNGAFKNRRPRGATKET